MRKRPLLVAVIVLSVIIVSAAVAAAGWLLYGTRPIAPQPASKPVEIPAVEAARTIKVKAFFLNNRLDPEVTCTRVFPVEREVPETKAVAGAALKELLAGPTEADKKLGYATAINDGVVVQRLVIEDGVAQADLSSRLEDQVGGSCRVAAIRAQMVETLKQFPTVKEVRLSVDGRTEDILQP